MDLRSYLRALRRGWWIVVLTTLAGGGLAFWFAEQTPQTYESSVTFFVSTPSEAASSAVEADQFAQRRVNSYVQLLTSERLATRIQDSTGLDLTLSEITQMIRASAEPETVLLTATVLDTSADRSLEIASAIGSEFGGMVDELDNRGSANDPTVQLNVTSGPSLNPTPVAPQVSMIVGLGLVLGLAAGFALVVVRESLDRTIRSTDELTALAGSPVLGVIGFDRSAKKTPLIVDGHSKSTRAEAFRQLRTNLQFVEAAQHIDALAVTSSVPGEGKTSTATNLALAFAEYGRRVLLIDGDLRRPMVADYLGLEGAVGLTNVLIGHVSLAEVLQPWGRGGLTVLTSGTIPPNPSELLGSAQMGALLDELRQRFDLIVIDTPPLLPVTDAAVVSRQADAAIIVVRYGKTTRHELTGSVQALDAVNARLLGTVLNVTPLTSDTYATYGPEAGAGGAGMLTTPPQFPPPAVLPDRDEDAEQSAASSSARRLGLRTPPEKIHERRRSDGRVDLPAAAPAVGEQDAKSQQSTYEDSRSDGTI